MSTYGLESQYVPYENEIEYASNQFGLNPNLLGGLLETEGGIDANGNNLTSNAGAVGIAQFMPATAQELGINANDPMQSIYGAAEYLSSLIKGWNGDVGAGVASYNEGPGGFASSGYAGTDNSNYAQKVQTFAQSLNLPTIGNPTGTSWITAPTVVGSAGNPGGGKVLPSTTASNTVNATGSGSVGPTNPGSWFWDWDNPVWNFLRGGPAPGVNQNVYATGQPINPNETPKWNALDPIGSLWALWAASPQSKSWPWLIFFLGLLIIGTVLIVGGIMDDPEVQSDAKDAAIVS